MSFLSRSLCRLADAVVVGEVTITFVDRRRGRNTSKADAGEAHIARAR